MAQNQEVPTKSDLVKALAWCELRDISLETRIKGLEELKLNYGEALDEETRDFIGKEIASFQEALNQ